MLENLCVMAGVNRSCTYADCEHEIALGQIIVRDVWQRNTSFFLQRRQFPPHQAIYMEIIFAPNGRLEAKYLSGRLGSKTSQNAFHLSLGNLHIRIKSLDVIYGLDHSDPVFFASSSGLIIGRHNHRCANELQELNSVVLLPRSSLLSVSGPHGLYVDIDFTGRARVRSPDWARYRGNCCCAFSQCCISVRHAA